MKKVFLATLVLTSLVQSCAPKKSGTAATSFNQNKIVLGKFYDSVTDSTFDESELSDLPEVVNLNDQTTPARNQSDRGTCTFFSTAALLESALKIDRNQDVNISEEFMNLVTKYAGNYPREEGSVVSANLYASKAYGFMLERDWGYQPSWFQKGLPCEKYKASDSSAPKTCFMHNVPSDEVQKTIIPFHGITFSSIDKNTNEIIRFLAKYKRPLTADVSVNFEGWQSANVFYNEKLRQGCLKTPESCGGHSVLLTGYDLKKKVFFFKNSWGKTWGDNGYGTMTFEMIDRYTTSPVFWASASEEVAIPEDYAKTHFKLESFDSKIIFNENTLRADVAGSISNLSGQSVYVSSFLAAKSRMVTGEINDANAFIVPLNPEDSVATGEGYYRVAKYYLPESTTSMSWSEEAPLMLELPGARNMNTVTSLLASEESDSFLRTTIYVHTDDESFKVLKRFYQPIK